MKLLVFTYEKFFNNEEEYINLLFESGLEILHLRKPDSNCYDVESLLRKIDNSHHGKIVLHQHFELTKKYSLKGIHLKASQRDKYNELKKDYKIVSTSCHSFEEISNLKQVYNYSFISPVFNSISKKGYISKFSIDELKTFSYQSSFSLVALGGININNIRLLNGCNLFGAAILGTLWTNFERNTFIKNFMEIKNAITS